MREFSKLFMPNKHLFSHLTDNLFMTVVIEFFGKSRKQTQK